MTVELNEKALEAAIDKAQAMTQEMSGGVQVPRQATAYITRETVTAYMEGLQQFVTENLHGGL